VGTTDFGQGLKIGSTEYLNQAASILTDCRTLLRSSSTDFMSFGQRILEWASSLDQAWAATAAQRANDHFILG
jgi:hypothetical protein